MREGMRHGRAGACKRKDDCAACGEMVLCARTEKQGLRIKQKGNKR